MSNIAKPRLRLKVIDPSEKTDNRMASMNAILGPRGIKSIEVLKEFDKFVSKKYAVGTEIIVQVIILVDPKGRSKKYTLSIGTPTISYLVKQELKVTKFLKKDNLTVTPEFVKKLVEIKKPSFEHISDESIYNTIVGTLKSMCISVS